MSQHLGTAATVASLPSQGMGGFGTELLFGICGGEISLELSPGALPASGPMRKTPQAWERAAPTVSAGLSPSWGVDCYPPSLGRAAGTVGVLGGETQGQEEPATGTAVGRDRAGTGPRRVSERGQGAQGREVLGLFLKLPIPSLSSKSQVLTPGQRTARHRDCNTRQAASCNWGWDWPETTQS